MARVVITPRVTLVLEGGQNEGSRDEYLEGIHEVERAARKQGVRMHWRYRNPVGGSSGISPADWHNIGSFAVDAAKNTWPVLAPLIVAWLKAKHGRKVSLQVGDTKAEATSIDEVKQLLEVAQTVKDKEKKIIS